MNEQEQWMIYVDNHLSVHPAWMELDNVIRHRLLHALRLASFGVDEAVEFVLSLLKDFQRLASAAAVTAIWGKWHGSQN